MLSRGKGREQATKTKQQEQPIFKVKYKSNDRKLFDEMPFSDLQFEVDGVLISAHRGIVASRCPSFAKIISEQADPTKAIKIENMDAATLKNFLEFIYCEECKFENMRSAMQLFEQAKSNALTDLADLAEKYLLKQITAENAVELANFSDKHSLLSLIEPTVHFLALEFDQIFDDKSSQHQVSELSNNILIKLFKDKRRLAALRDPHYTGLGHGRNY